MPGPTSRTGLRWMALGALASVAAAAVYVLWRDEGRVVRARVDAAAAAVSSRPGEGDLDRLARLAGLGKLLAADVVVEAEPGGPAIRGRDAVVGLASQLTAAGGPQRVELTDVEVVLDQGKVRATVTAVVRVTSASPGEAPRAGAVSTFHGDVVQIDLVKTGGEWLITRAAPQPALAR